MPHVLAPWVGLLKSRAPLQLGWPSLAYTGVTATSPTGAGLAAWAGSCPGCPAPSIMALARDISAGSSRSLVTVSWIIPANAATSGGFHHTTSEGRS